MFGQWAANFQQDGTVKWLTDELTSGDGNRRWPNDSELRLSLTSIPAYGKKICRVVLERFESSYKHKEPADLSQATVEHIMPQSLTEEWRKEIGTDWETIHAGHLHTIGNLTLTAYNSELGNIPFDQKKQKLADSHIILNNWICKQKHWNRGTISRRAEELGNIAVQLWPIAGAIE